MKILIWREIPEDVKIYIIDERFKGIDFNKVHDNYVNGGWPEHEDEVNKLSLLLEGADEEGNLLENFEPIVPLCTDNSILLLKNKENKNIEIIISGFYL